MIMNPSTIHEVVIDGHSLTIESFVAVARFGAKVSVSPEAIANMQKSRDLAEKIAAEKRVAYGITTGFGDFAKVAVPEEMSNTLSTNLILSHCTATGEPYSEEVVRGMLLLRANALCVGVSGVRPVLVTMMAEMLNKGVVPVVPQKGSLGASGDLAPLAHMSLPLLGKGRAYYQGVEMDGGEAMAKAGIQTLDTLVCKEGLGLTNGTCAMTSVGTLALYDTICASQLADLIASMSMEALTGLLNAFDERVHAVRGHKGQLTVAKNFRLLTEGSEILSNCQQDRVQDAYSLRCIPQVHGAIRDAIDYVKEKVSIELNAVTDNPLVFLDDENVISGGNFHGEPMALAFDFLGIACSEIADISERRTERMVNAALSNGLTHFLTTDKTVAMRTQGVGVLTREDAIRIGAVGPHARASGVDIDVRRDAPYTSYEDFDFNIPVVESGDVYARVLIRVLETYESMKIVRQAVDMLPEGPINLGNKIPKVPAGEFVGCHEAPRGQLVYKVVTNGGPTNHRLSIHVPTFKNAPTVETMLKGNTVADAGLIVASIDPCFSCMDC